MYVKKLQIDDLRSFHHAELEFLAPGARAAPGEKLPRLRNVNVLLGINGSGKSTVLDAIALALLSPLIASSGYRPYALIRRAAKMSTKRASVTVDAQLNDQGRRSRCVTMPPCSWRNSSVRTHRSLHAPAPISTC